MKTRIAALGAALAAASVAMAGAPSQGEVTKIDKAAGRITLKHGEIANLGMPPMTMVFRVSPPKLLDEVAVGDRVRFVAERVDGNYTVTSMSKLP